MRWICANQENNDLVIPLSKLCRPSDLVNSLNHLIFYETQIRQTDKIANYPEITLSKDLKKLKIHGKRKR